MSLASRMLVLGTILVNVGCDSSPVAPRSYGDGDVRMTVTAPNLAITSESQQRIVYVVMTADHAALVLLSLRGWPSLDPGETVSFNYSEIPGYEQGKEQEVLIQWATVTGSQDGPADAASIKYLRAPL